jgi:hypothetical protein
MKILFSAARATCLAAVLTAPSMINAAHATDVTLKLSPDTQNSIAQLPAFLDQCVASLTMRGDATACKSISAFLVGMGNQVKLEAQVEAKAEAEKAAADKVAADKAAASVPPSAAPVAPQGNPALGAGAMNPASQQ